MAGWLGLLRASLVVMVTVFGLVAGLNLGPSTLASASTTSSTEPLNSTQDPVQQCIDTCHAFIEQPGPELRRCVSDCLAIEAARWRNFTATKCETYEEDCDRGEDDPSDPTEPEPSDDDLF